MTDGDAQTILDALRDSLRRALDERNTEAGLSVTAAMDSDPAVDSALAPDLDTALEQQPDALYALIRARLNTDTESDSLPDFRWLARLHAAARAALRVAMDEGDSETILNWLRLIAREPAAYEMGAILRDGLTASLPRAQTDPVLAYGLLALAVKRDPLTLSILIDEPALVASLDDEALMNLIGLLLREKRDDRFPALARLLMPLPQYASLLAGGFERSGRPAGDLLAITAQLTAAGDLSAQDTLDIDLALVEAHDWSPAQLPLMAQIARLAQSPSLHIETDALWKLLEVAETQRDDLIARCATRRLETVLTNETDDAVLVEWLNHLIDSLEWNSNAQAAVQTWWRGFVGAQPLARLQRLEKLLEGRRGLEDARAALHSVIAFRKMLGKKSLGEFADSISLAYALLQALGDAYDPSSRRSGEFDPAALRAELDASAAPLSPQERRLFANNLKALAQLIGDLGDHRSKTSLIRRGEDMDHQLASGEQAPHSAVDALKWMAGYLEGGHEE